MCGREKKQITNIHAKHRQRKEGKIDKNTQNDNVELAFVCAAQFLCNDLPRSLFCDTFLAWPTIFTFRWGGFREDS